MFRLKKKKMACMMLLFVMVCSFLFPGGFAFAEWPPASDPPHTPGSGPGDPAPPPRSAFSEPEPSFEPAFNVDPLHNHIWGHQWTPHQPLLVTIRDGEDLLFQTGAGELFADPEGGFNLELFGRFNVAAGQTITVSGGGKSSAHIVKPLAITDVDVHNKLITGHAEAGSKVHVYLFLQDREWPYCQATAGEDGSWQATFAEPVMIGPGSSIIARQMDDAGNFTWINWHLPNPIFRVNSHKNNIFGHTWPANGELAIKIYDGADGKNMIFESAAGEVRADSGGNFSFNINVPVTPGYLVKVSDGNIEKVHLVAPLHVNAIDIEHDTIAGMTGPYGRVHVEIHDGGAARTVLADRNGQWLADFSQPAGNEPWDAAHDIVPGTRGGVFVPDNDGNATFMDWYLPNPSFVVIRDDNSVFGFDWPNNSQVAIKVNGSGNDLWVAGTDGNGFFDLRNLEGLDPLVPGDKVAVVSGGLEREHVVTNLVVTEVDSANDIVRGTAAPGSMLLVQVHDNEYSNPRRMVTADENGCWFADFSVEGIGNDFRDKATYDLVPGTGGSVDEFDRVINASTRLHWQLHNPHFKVEPLWGNIRGYGWPAGTELFIVIRDENGATIYNSSTNSDSRGNFEFYLWAETDLKILPGYEIAVYTEGESIVKNHTISRLRIINVDVATDSISGTAEGNSLVHVKIFEPTNQVFQNVEAGADGIWKAAFQYNIQPESSGMAEIADEEGNATAVFFNRAGASISGTVKDPDGNAVGGASIAADLITGEGQFARVSDAIADVNGEYSLQGFVQGEYKIFAKAPGMKREEKTIIYPEQKVVDFVLELLPPGTISGRVRGPSGAPLSGVSVEILKPDGRHFDATVTGSDGSYSLNVPFGKYKVCSPDGGRWAPNDFLWVRQWYPNLPAEEGSDEITVDADHPHISGIDFQLQAGGNISGRVTDENGAGINGAFVRARLRVSEGEWRMLPFVHTKADGSYSIYGLQAGTYRVSAEATHLAPRYAERYYPGGSSWENAGTIIAAPGENTPGIDIILGAGAPSPRGDLNGDGVVDIVDLAMLSQAYGMKAAQMGFNPRYDLNNDGIIDLFDLVLLARNWTL